MTTHRFIVWQSGAVLRRSKSFMKHVAQIRDVIHESYKTVFFGKDQSSAMIARPKPSANANLKIRIVIFCSAVDRGEF